jgi:hypothetical protein
LRIISLFTENTWLLSYDSRTRLANSKSVSQAAVYSGQVNIFLCLAVKSQTKKFLCKSDIERPTHVDYIVNVYGAAQCDQLQSRHNTISTCKTLL